MATAENAVAENASAECVTALYVGDIDVNVTEEELHLLFDQIGELISVKLCTDQTTEKSLGYGYVNYGDPEHAAKAIEDLKFTRLNGKCIRISYSIRDANLRNSGAGNVFVKNLDKEIDHKALHEIFSPFGDIISSKVETDASGNSKGYGFVHYSSEESAKNAIEKLNGVILHEKEIYVGPFISKKEKGTMFTNVFVKNLAELTTEEDLKTIFGEFGSITSAVVMRDDEGNSKCFGFVNFENSEDAVKSVEELNGRVFNGKKWYVGKAQKKSERERELKLRYEQIVKGDGLNNLYVKNLDDKIDDDKLKELFSSFGTIISSKVMYNPNGTSKGSGFVAFSTGQEASRAILEMNGKIIENKPLYVAIAEKREVRRARLHALFSNMRPYPILPAVAPPMHIYNPCGGRQIFYPPPILPTPPGFGYQRQLVPGARPGGAAYPSVVFPMAQPAGFQGPRPSGIRPRGGSVQPIQPMVPMMHNQMLSRENGYRLHPVGGHSFARGINPLSKNDERIHSSVPIEDLASALANASLAEQTTMLGEKLYPLVEQVEHEMAAKITGMLLEMDQTEVLHLIESPESLRAKIVEAKSVLQNTPQ